MVKRVMLLFVILVGLLAVPQPARADDGGGCTTTLLQCYEKAAKIDSFWYRWAAGLDCEIQYAGCVRETVMGL